MNTDAFFTVGRQHHVCQDYALAGPDWVALSDGCSSSPHTDFGSRFLCRMAARSGARLAAALALPLLEPLGLPAEALDATLLVARRFEGSVRVSIYGDGVVVARRRDGGSLTKVSSFPSGAPLYQSYSVDPDRKARYLAKFGGTQVIRTITSGVDDAFAFEHREDTSDGTVCEFSVADFDLVLLLSDGAQSFRRPDPTHPGGFESVPLEEVVEGLLAIKGYAGEFMTRRAKRFLRDVVAEGWHHVDDFSVAALYLGGTP